MEGIDVEGLSELTEAARRVRDELLRLDARVVFAESCTAGLVAATMGGLPGVSQVLCGSFVVYRCDSKTRWLGVTVEQLEDPRIGPVSLETSRALCHGALDKTPEARFALAITGDLGPGAPLETDGWCFVAMADRVSECSINMALQLTSAAPTGQEDVERRQIRQMEATLISIQKMAEFLSVFDGSN